MREFMQHLFPPSQMDVLSMFVGRLLVAAILGAAIGLEREARHKPAGLRTNMFICFGAAMFTVLSDTLAGQHAGDHTRIAAQVIPGIGFIGAGSIMRSGMTVSGLTTAATMFVVASVGMAAGGGLYVPAIFATLLILLSLEILGKFEQRFNLKPPLMMFEVLGASADAMVAEIGRVLEADHLTMENTEISKNDEGFRLRFGLMGSRLEAKNVGERLQGLRSAKRIIFIGTRSKEWE
jgi:putative Mg2+ transporter-C (MgtC) family protein